MRHPGLFGPPCFQGHVWSFGGGSQGSEDLEARISTRKRPLGQMPTFLDRPLPWMEGIGAAPVARLLHLRSDLLVCLGESGFKIAAVRSFLFPLCWASCPLHSFPFKYKRLGSVMGFLSPLPRNQDEKGTCKQKRKHTHKQKMHGGGALYPSSFSQLGFFFIFSGTVDPFYQALIVARVRTQKLEPHPPNFVQQRDG